MFISLGPDRAIYRQICDAIRHRIVSGELPPGARLPSTRGLAAELGVSRRSVLVAYDQLLAASPVTRRTSSSSEDRAGAERRRPRRSDSVIARGHA
jgi:GntR family transcriptional regulator / MocR family aminotransferase